VVTRAALPRPRLPGRALRRRVLSEISLLRDQHFFLAVLADRQGFRVREVERTAIAQGSLPGQIPRPRVTPIASSTSSTVFFLVRFTKKPLRFFGIDWRVDLRHWRSATSYLVVDRLVLHHPLADRPRYCCPHCWWYWVCSCSRSGCSVSSSSLPIARGIKDYQVDEVIQYPQRETGNPAPRVARNQNWISSRRNREPGARIQVPGGFCPGNLTCWRSAQRTRSPNTALCFVGNQAKPAPARRLNFSESRMVARSTARTRLLCSLQPNKTTVGGTLLY